MGLVDDAFAQLYPTKEFPYAARVVYSGKFSPYNANLRRSGNTLVLNLSRAWRPVSREIVLGLAQVLLLKLFKDKKETLNIQLYNSFIRNLHLSIPKEQSDPALAASFSRVNEQYFYNVVEMPNLRWGSHSCRELGSYNYHTDTITISRVFMDADDEFLDYIMYHEVLHKKLKFKDRKTRSYHHTHEFRSQERQFENYPEMERQIAALVRSYRARGLFRGLISSPLKNQKV